MNNERLIKFPLPNWNRITPVSFDGLIKCFCYQYDVSDSLHGPYGFDTKLSLEILHRAFRNAYYFDCNEKKISEAIFLKKNGLYFYDNFTPLINEFNLYQLAVKKNEYKIKKGMIPDNLPLKPDIVDANEEVIISERLISKLIREKVGFFIVNHYSPEAGQSILVFSEDLCVKLCEAAKKYNVNMEVVSSINDLKPW